MLTTVGVSTVVWLSATYLTLPEPAATLEAFYHRVRPGGPGWWPVSRGLGYGREPIPGGALAWTNWVAGIVAVYATLFGIGRVVFGDTAAGAGLFGAYLLVPHVAGVAFAWIGRSLRQSPPDPVPASGRPRAEEPLPALALE